MAHGYLGDGYGSHGEIDPDRDDRDRAWRESERDRRDWSERGSHERGRGFMFDTPERHRGESRYGPEHGFGGFQGDYEGGRQQGGFGGYGDYAGGRRSFSAHPDDHYRSWRDRQMEALDRDYEDYCREREQQFHREFDDWRRNRVQNRPDDSELVLRHERSETDAALGGPNPMSEATLGSNNSENATRGRGGKR